MNMKEQDISAGATSHNKAHKYETALYIQNDKKQQHIALSPSHHCISAKQSRKDSITISKKRHTLIEAPISVRHICDMDLWDRKPVSGPVLDSGN